MKKSEEIASVATALLDVQSKIGKVKKDSKGYGYSYSSLDHVIDVLRPILVECGLAVTQCMDIVDGKDILTTTIIHAGSGQWIQSTFALNPVASKQMNDAQQMGSAITYARRYCLLAILNIATGDDDDAAKTGLPQAARSEPAKSGPANSATKPQPSPEVKKDFQYYHDEIMKKVADGWFEKEKNSFLIAAKIIDQAYADEKVSLDEHTKLKKLLGDLQS